MTEQSVAVVGHRCLDVTHPDGHRWFFHFPEGWVGGAIPRYAPTQYVNDERPDDPFFDNYASTLALGEAKRQGWI